MSGWSSAFPINEITQVGEARRAASLLADEIGLDETRRGQAALVVTELGNNLLRHAGAGEVVIRALGEPTYPGIEILAIDKGPGMADVRQCLADGFSTSSTLGAGLGGIQRMSSQFDVYSKPGAGTIIMSRIFGPAGESAKPDHGARFEIGVVCRAMPGEQVCGDAYHIEESADRLSVAVIDALGHGPAAFATAKEALEVCRSSNLASPSAVLDNAHGRLRSTRGAVLGVASIDAQRNEAIYAGIGNIAGTILDGDKTTHMISMNGTVGQIARPPREFAYPWAQTSVMILVSDGIQTGWRLPDPHTVMRHHASMIAALIYRDWRRQRDDATVVVVREKGWPT